MLIVTGILLAAALVAAHGSSAERSKTLNIGEIRIRDPFILPVPEEGRYYMYGTTGSREDPRSFQCYFSSDLEHWHGPVTAFRWREGFWATRDYWAPEVHKYRGRYFMFASFKADGICRGTQVLVADRPRGPFRPHSPEPVTPPDWECLDGTLFVDDAEDPWMVFCHEWVQTHDGEMCAVRLTPELDKPVGKPVLLFRASEGPWVAEPAWIPKADGARQLVTDGPFLHRATSGELLMLWSSFSSTGYATGLARSKSGKVTGPWVQEAEPVFAKDGGHAMLFTRFHRVGAATDGQLMLSLHQPNSYPERPVFLPVQEIGGRIVVL